MIVSSACGLTVAAVSACPADVLTTTSRSVEDTDHPCSPAPRPPGAWDSLTETRVHHHDPFPGPLRRCCSDQMAE